MKQSKMHTKIMCKNGLKFTKEKHIYLAGGIVLQVSKVFSNLLGGFFDKESSQVVVDSLG